MYFFLGFLSDFSFWGFSRVEALLPDRFVVRGLPPPGVREDFRVLRVLLALEGLSCKASASPADLRDDRALEGFSEEPLLLMVMH